MYIEACRMGDAVKLRDENCHNANFVDTGGIAGCRLTTCGADNVDKVGIMKTLGLQCYTRIYRVYVPPARTLHGIHSGHISPWYVINDEKT